MHALKCEVNHTMQKSPRALVFCFDMLMDVPLIADLDATRGRRQQLIDDNLIRMNRKRADHNYSVNDIFLLRVADPIKIEDIFKGPYIIVGGSLRLDTYPNPA